MGWQNCLCTSHQVGRNSGTGEYPAQEAPLLPWLTMSLFSATKTLLVPAYVLSPVLLLPCHFFMNLFLYHYEMSLFLEIFFFLKSILSDVNIVTLDFFLWG